MSPLKSLRQPQTKTLPAKVIALLAACVLTACANHAPVTGTKLDTSEWGQATQLPVAEDGTGPGWHERRVGKRQPTLYRPTRHAGRPALMADSAGGDSLVRIRLRGDAPADGLLHFSWFSDGLNEDADLADTAVDDAVVRVILQFGGDRSPFTPRDHRMSELVRLVTGEPLPHAPLIYVWDPERPVGTVIRHRRTDRIRKLVVQSGTDGLGRWNDFARDVAADFRHAFGEAPVRLESIALMTDANNTGRHTRAWYGPLRWTQAASGQAEPPRETPATAR